MLQRIFFIVLANFFHLKKENQMQENRFGHSLSWNRNLDAAIISKSVEKLEEKSLSPSN